MRDMMARHAQAGRVTWIGLRPARRAGMQPVAAAEIGAAGLEGDHGRPGKRAVTLIQAEHLPVIAGMLGRDAVAPEDLRRNLIVAGINLGALRGVEIRVGGARLLIETLCAPCSRMEETFGHGGYNAVRGHGGWCARVLEGGRVALGDGVVPH
ncbi:MOSC domain-containing protein [Palleronia marisminoris]|uniref:MOSC domain protein n=2 Tax=Palleronia marisminoris TaxID=315423 RepID=A0A1Y5TNS8_9RHOB|nr:MOSC domain-containing protein [Palleronia marisminoris]SLN64726.1 MOSC domain protein [Palleronia marisminoris]